LTPGKLLSALASSTYLLAREEATDPEHLDRIFAETRARQRRPDGQGSGQPIYAGL
jgi:hypothetical protein